MFINIKVKFAEKMKIRERGIVKRTLEIRRGSSHGGLLPPNIAEVNTFDNGATLYRSGLPQIQHIETLRNELGIRRILYLRGILNRDEYLEKLRSFGIDYEFFGWNTKRITFESLLYFLARISPIDSNTLVCCRAGADRTGMAIASTRIELFNTRDVDALIGEMKQYGHVQWECYRYYRALLEKLIEEAPFFGK